MKSGSGLSKGLAWVGTILIWAPFAFMIGLTVMRLVQAGRFQMDYLITAELAPVILVGGVLLYWAAAVAKSHRGMIGWSMLAAVVLLVGSQMLAVVTGLASGAAEPEDWRLAVVTGGIVAYNVAVVVAGVGGVKLVCHLRQDASGQESARE